MKSAFYVTTPIYYVNDVPHIGHAYCTVLADVLARYHRLQGEEVLFLTGTDEHGQKVEKAAAEKGLEPQIHADKMVIPFKKLWQRYEISYDDFIRTTESRHQKVVQAIFQKLSDQGDIYKGYYEGWYCIHEETFWPESQLIEKKCPECHRPVEWLKEESYYFRCSKYTDKLLDWINGHENFITPISRRNEVISLIKSGIQDISVSRTSISWGIPVPFNKSHTIYVWFDALINYLTGAGYLIDQEKFDRFWPPVHLLGKDILKFHAIVWPCMLLALGIKLPQAIATTGFWTLGSEKISKSKGIVIDPNELADEFGIDVVRYFFIRQVPIGQDGEFTRQALVRRLNHDLANDLGNLLHRSLPMVKRYFSGKIPKPSKETSLTDHLRKKAEKTIEEYFTAFNKQQLREAIAVTWQLVSHANKYIDQVAPWQLYKEEKTSQLVEATYGLLETIRIIALLISPFIPSTARKIYQQLGLSSAPEDQGFSYLKWGNLPANLEVSLGEPLFPRVEDK